MEDFDFYILILIPATSLNFLLLQCFCFLLVYYLVTPSFAMKSPLDLECLWVSSRKRPALSPLYGDPFVSIQLENHLRLFVSSPLTRCATKSVSSSVQWRLKTTLTKCKDVYFRCRTSSFSSS